MAYGHTDGQTDTVRRHTGCLKKVAPKKTFWNIFNSVKSFCVKFCKFVGNSYPHISANFCTFILIFHQMALIFPRVPVVFTRQVLSRPIHPENEKQLFGNDVIFSSSSVSVSDNCKQMITVWIFTTNVLLTLLSASLYVSKRGAYWDRLCRDVVGRCLLVVGWSLVVTRVHCGQTVHPRPIVTMEH